MKINFIYFIVKINEEDIDLIYDEIIEKIDDEELTYENYRMVTLENPEILDFFDIFNNKILENMTVVINKQIIARLNGLYESFDKITDKLHKIKMHKNGLTLSLSNFIERSIKNKSLINNIGFNNPHNSLYEKSINNNDVNSINSKASNQIFSISKKLDNDIFSDEEIYMDNSDSENSVKELSAKKKVSFNENNDNKSNNENIEKLIVNDKYKEKNIMVNNINNINNIHILNNNITNLNDLQILSKMNKFNLSKNKNNNNNINNNNNNNNIINLNQDLPQIYNFNDNNIKYNNNNNSNSNIKLNEKNFFISVKIK
jgi:hypothetical protein